MSGEPRQKYCGPGEIRSGLIAAGQVPVVGSSPTGPDVYSRKLSAST